MLEEEGKCSRSYGMPPELICAQSESIGLPVYMAAASWDDYEKVFIQLLESAKRQGAEVLVTGDLEIPVDDSWNEKVTEHVGLRLGMPLWRKNPR